VRWNVWILADQAAAVFSAVVSAATRALLLPGFNDVRAVGPSSVAQATHADVLRACLVWLALPHAAKLAGQHPALRYAGTWGTAQPYPTLGLRYSTQAGATATAYLPGTAVYVGTSVRTGFGNGGTFTVTVDVQSAAVCDTNQGVVPVSGRLFWPAVVRVGGLAPGWHEVVVTQTAEGRYVNLDWLATNVVLPGLARPVVACGNTLRLPASGYAVGAPTWNHATPALIATWNAVAADGLDVRAVDACAAYAPDACQVDVDLVHPNDAGHAALGQAFLAALG
jgi:hypothetical protein